LSTEKKRLFFNCKGDQIEAGSTAPIHIQLFDDHNQSSEDIRLLRKDNHIHNFVPGGKTK